MTSPYRGITCSDTTYFVTFNCDQKKRLLQSQRMATTLMEILLRYRTEGKYRLHQFVIMPNHVHLLMTTIGDLPLQADISIIKGAASYRAKRDFRLPWRLWQSSFVDRRVRDHTEFQNMQAYIWDNPVKAGLCAKREDWP